MVRRGVGFGVVAWLAALAIGGTAAGGVDELGAPATVLGPAARALRVNIPRQHLDFGFTGDFLTHRIVNRAASQPDGSFDYRPMLANIAPVIRWFDDAICNFEQPVAPPGTTVYPEPLIMSTAPELPYHLVDAGFDRCSTANNHAADRQAAGVDTTLNVFDAAGLGHAGTARSPAEADPTLYAVDGVRVAHLAYTYSLNGLPMPNGQSWRANLIDVPRILADAAAARAGGARFVIVSLHWGVEKAQWISNEQRSIAQRLTASPDIDLIVGHHAHVLQPIEQINGKWVLFGLGNILSNHPTSSNWPAASQDAAIVHVGVAVEADGSLTVERPAVIPTWVDRQAGFVIRLTSEMNDPNLPASTRAQLAASRDRTWRLLGPYFAPDS